MSEQTEFAEGDGPIDPAAQAFEALRAEVQHLRLMLTDRATERAAIEIPDYTATLGKILQAVQMTSVHLKTLAEMPALRLSPSSLSREIAVAGEDVRRHDRATLETARKTFDEVAHDLASRLLSARSADNQRQWLIWTGLISLFAGMLLWAVSLGPLLRSTPESWHWPEQMAAYLIGMREEEAGAHLIATTAPDHWRDLVLGYRIVTSNRNTIAQCQQQRETARKPVSCAILVQDPASE